MHTRNTLYLGYRVKTYVANFFSFEVTFIPSQLLDTFLEYFQHLKCNQCKIK